MKEVVGQIFEEKGNPGLVDRIARLYNYQKTSMHPGKIGAGKGTGGTNHEGLYYISKTIFSFTNPKLRA